ncbi:MAG TPA: deoxynucleoside kinase, partial [Gemmatimonadaceae bacterium]|nr:deoxynucleoside kinase [Gemmatimonadaceae bacterium]
DVILERIATRGRALERDADPEYFAQLHARYERWIAGFKKCPLIKLDVREYDLFSDPAGAAEDIAARVRTELEGEIPQTELWPGIKRIGSELEAR